jgi:putative Holliday junction resolvase
MQSRRTLGIDFGTKRIGTAIGDTETRIATGYRLLAYSSHKALIDELKKIVAEEAIAEIVLGLPMNMNGSGSKMTEEIAGLAEKIKREIGIPVITIDETLSSEEAIRRLPKMQKKKGRSGGSVDITAATLILQEYLDSLA